MYSRWIMPKSAGRGRVMAASVRKAWRVTEGVRGNEAEISQTLIYKFPHRPCPRASRAETRKDAS